MPGGRQALKAAELCLLQPLGKASPARPHLATLCRGQKFCDGFWLQATSGHSWPVRTLFNKGWYLAQPGPIHHPPRGPAGENGHPAGHASSVQWAMVTSEGPSSPGLGWPVAAAATRLMPGPQAQESRAACHIRQRTRNLKLTTTRDQGAQSAYLTDGKTICKLRDAQGRTAKERQACQVGGFPPSPGRV